MLINFLNGTEQAILNLKSTNIVQEGAVYLATDTGALYVGSGVNSLIRIHDDTDYLNGIIDQRLSDKTKDKTATSSAKRQVISADDGTVMSQVTIEPMPYAEEDNSAGGTTVTIG